MITRTVTEREGEWFTDGTADEWFAEHAAFAAQHEGPRPLDPKQEKMIRRLTTKPPEGAFWLVCTDGYWHRLLVVGMYDGWVWWRRRLCVGTDGPLPVMHHHEAYQITGVALGVKADNFQGWTFRAIPGADEGAAS